MTKESQFEQIADLFDQARKRPAPDRLGFLRDACGDDTDLFDEVFSLLDCHEDESGALDGVAMAIPQVGTAGQPDRIGGYRIVEQLGVGGMGIVYRAEQDNPKRTAAIKVIRSGFVSRELLKRFELEAAVLGRLQHPGIAKIHEAGMYDDGSGARPFFAMEYVEGLACITFAQKNNLDVRARLAMFTQICDAVHHAHQRGVIHRDLKPANILVDQNGQPRILDFGVARATDSDLQVTTLQTDVGQLVGTLPYMSPEQVTGSAQDVDTRSDVYALGVVLYELLGDRLPYDLRGRTIVTAAQVIADESPTPLSSINRVYRGDLNTIVLKSLEKDRDRRYQSASDLGADVQRFLDHEPINARPTTALYHMSRFARRHRGLVAGLAGIMVVLVVGMAGMAWQAALVNAESKTRQDVSSFLREMLTSIDPKKTAGEPFTVRQLLDDSARRLEDRFGDAPLVRADLHETVGETYFLVGSHAEAEHHIRLAIEGYEQELGPDDGRTIAMMASLGAVLSQLDRLEEAEAILRDAMTRLELPGFSPIHHHVRQNLANVLDDLGQDEEAERLHRMNYDHALERLGPDHPDTLMAQNNLGKLLMDAEDFEESLQMLEGCLAGRRLTLGNDDPVTITSIANLGALYGNMGREADSAALLKEAALRSERILGPVHVDTLRRRRNLVASEMIAGRFDEGARMAREFLEVAERELGPQHRETIQALELQVTCVALGGDMEGAESLAMSWYNRLEAEFGEVDRSTGRVALLLYNLYDTWGRTEEATVWLNRSERSLYQQ